MHINGDNCYVLNCNIKVLQKQKQRISKDQQIPKILVLVMYAKNIEHQTILTLKKTLYTSWLKLGFFRPSPNRTNLYGTASFIYLCFNYPTPTSLFYNFEGLLPRVFGNSLQQTYFDKQLLFSCKYQTIIFHVSHNIFNK